MSSNPPNMSLEVFLAGTAEQTFQVQLGVVDPPLIDYISGLLLRFVRVDGVNRVRTLRGQPINELGQLVAEAESRVGLAKREVLRHIGDFTLFWAGLFPESLRRGRAGGLGDYFGEYCTHGRRSYLVASTIDTDQTDDAPNELLERLGRQFEMCAYGLREVRREWERRNDDDDTVRPYLIN